MIFSVLFFNHKEITKSKVVIDNGCNTCYNVIDPNTNKTSIMCTKKLCMKYTEDK